MLGEPIRPGVDTTPVPLDLGVSPKVEHFATVRMLVTAHMMTRAICVTDNDEVGQHPGKSMPLSGRVCVCVQGGWGGRRRIFLANSTIGLSCRCDLSLLSIE